MSSNYTNGILNGWSLSEEKSKADVSKFVLFEQSRFLFETKLFYCSFEASVHSFL